jgi:hypothetical protein
MRTQTKIIKLVIISCSFTIILLVSSEEAMVASKEFITSVVVGKCKISTQSHSSGCPNKRRIGYIDTKYMLDVLVLNLEMEDRDCSSLPERWRIQYK